MTSDDTPPAADPAVIDAYVIDAYVAELLINPITVAVTTLAPSNPLDDLVTMIHKLDARPYLCEPFPGYLIGHPRP